VAETSDNYDNFENLVKKYMPEFVDITRMPSGPTANFAQQAMSQMLNDGVVPKDTPPPFPIAIMMEKEHGR